MLDRPIVRVGSDATCEVPLPPTVIGAHPVSLEIRDGRCRLHNHEAEGAELGGRKIPPGKSSDWGPGQVLRLSKDVKFRLMNRALPRKTSALPSPPRTANGQSASHVGSGAPAWSALAFIFIISGGAYVLWPSQTPVTDVQVRADLRDLVDRAHHRGTAIENLHHAEFCLAIQSARIAALRGDAKAASKILIGVRDALVQQRRPDGSFDDPWNNQCLELVKKMEQLSAR